MSRTGGDRLEKSKDRTGEASRKKKPTKRGESYEQVLKKDKINNAEVARKSFPIVSEVQASS